MEILKRGIVPEQIRYVSSCSHCKTEVAFMQCEGKITYDQRDGNFITVECPVCNRDINKAI